MRSVDYRFVVRAPVEFCGEIMGKLTTLDVEVTSIDDDGHVWTIKASARTNIFEDFEPWLLALTRSSGSLEKL